VDNGLVFERFTERARQVVVLAQDEARALRHGYIGTEHLLLGLLAEEEGAAARALNSHAITQNDARMAVARIVGRGEGVTSGQLPFTPRAKHVLELSLREALSLGQNHIATEHILLGIVRENAGIAARVLLDFGVDAEDLRTELFDVASGARQAPEASGRPRSAGILAGLVIRAADPAAAARFYGEVFGWNVRPLADGVFAFEDRVLRLAGIWVEDPTPPDGGVRFAVEVRDMAAVREAVVMHGGEIVDAPVELDLGGDPFWFRDPSGHLVCVYGAP
jgi:predicted enzyme related to lactoylglutathione lyase